MASYHEDNVNQFQDLITFPLKPPSPIVTERNDGNHSISGEISESLTFHSQSVFREVIEEPGGSAQSSEVNNEVGQEGLSASLISPSSDSSDIFADLKEWIQDGNEEAILEKCLTQTAMPHVLAEMTTQVGSFLNSLNESDDPGLTCLLEKFQDDPQSVLEKLYKIWQKKMGCWPAENPEIALNTIEGVSVVETACQTDDVLPESSTVAIAEQPQSVEDLSPQVLNSITQIRREEFVQDIVLEEAHSKMDWCEGDREKMKACGKILFRHIFTEKEKAECYAGDKNNRKEFPFQKVRNMSRALRWLLTNPPVRTLDELNKIKEEPLESSQFKVFKQDILIDYANQIRGKRKKEMQSI